MMACAVLSACAASTFAGIVETNPLCIAAIAEGYAVIQKGEKGQTRNQAEMAVLQNAIGAEYTMMKNWESKYNSYLKTDWRLSGTAGTRAGRQGATADRRSWPR